MLCPVSCGDRQTGKRATYQTIQPTLHGPAQIFFLGELPSRSPQLRSPKSLLCTPLQDIHCVGNYCGIPRRQKSNRIVFLWKKNPIFSCQRNSFKMSSMLFSSQQLVFNSTFQITWMPTQNIWQRLDCWQVGCYSGNFEPDKKKN